MKENFSHLDEYFCFKTLAYYGADLKKFGARFHEKYYKVRKWLFLKGIIRI